MKGVLLKISIVFFLFVSAISLAYLANSEAAVLEVNNPDKKALHGRQLKTLLGSRQKEVPQQPVNN